MALVLKDRVKETSVSTGTGAIALDGAAGAFQAFSVIGDGNQTYYAIAGQASSEWEVGIGTYTLSTDTLSRDVILASSNSDTIVTFSAGTKDVFITYPSEKAIFEEPSGETLINAGPITVVGAGVTSIPSLPAELGKFIGDVDSFAQIYTFNQNDGTTASADFVAYNDLTTDGYTYFTDMGISSSNYTSVDYPLFTPNSGYVFHQGGDFFIGNQTTDKDVVIFSGGVDVTDIVATFSGTDLSTTLEGALDVATTLDVGGAATFGSTVLLDADPTLALQAATKQYVDNAVSTGIHIHQPVQLERGSNLTATYNNGTAGVGATLTNSGTQVALTIDGVATSVSDRILVYGQTAPAENGVYVVSDIGSGSTNWVLTRASDADTYDPQNDMALGGGDYFFVQEGLTGAGESYVCTNDGVIVFGTTAITFTQFSASPAYVGGTNIDVTGQTISLTGTVAATNGGTGTATVTTGDLLYGSASNTWSKLGVGAAYKSLVVNAAGTQVEWNAVALNQSAAISGALGPLNGGTGQSAYTVGDTLYSGSTDTLSKLAGITSTSKHFLSQTGTGSASAAPSWAELSATDITSGTLPAVRGGTGQSSYAVGDLLYADTTSSLAKLADVATGNVLLSGGISAAPSWGKVALASAVSGTLGVANGGTGVTSSTGSGNVVLSTSPTLVTPILGTPQSGDFSSGTFTWPTFNQNTTGTAGNVSGTVAIANGGTGETTRQAAIDALAGATTSGYYLRGNGTDVVMAAIVAGDVPTLNQNTTGSSGSCTGNAATATTATNATNVATTNDLVTAVTVYPTWITGTGNVPVKFSSTKLSFVPSTGVLSSTSFAGSGASLTALNATQLTTGTVPDARITGSYTGMTNLTGSGDVDFARFLGNAADTALLPSYTWTGDPNTGLYQPAADQVGITTGGTSRLTVSTTAITAELPYIGAGATSGSTSTSFVTYSGTTNTAGQFNGGTTTPTGATRLNYGGYFYPTYINLLGSADTAGAASHYFCETASDGYVRPKTLANVKTELNVNTTSNLQINSLGVGTAASGTAGEIRATNNVTAYYSDDRFKTNLGNIPNALDKVQSLNGFYYEANELAQSYGYEKKLEVGVSAQQVQAIMPEVVAPAPIDDNYLTVRYERLVPLLIEAIKELKAEVDELKKAR